MRSILTKDIALRRVEPEILDGLAADDPAGGRIRAATSSASMR